VRTKSINEPITERRVPVCLRCDTPMPGHRCLYGICQGCIDREQQHLTVFLDALRSRSGGIPTRRETAADDVPF